MNYSGDVSARQAWDALSQTSNAVLVDVRSRAEWTFVGVVDLRSLKKEPVLVEWQVFPGMAVNTAFVSEVSAELQRRGVGKDAELYFLCRSGGRSRSAAEAMTAAGFVACYNVAGGFEGDVDDQHHRGQLVGWKAQNLPWAQG